MTQIPQTAPLQIHDNPFFALGEIDALCKKAARGAGFSWGMAEEIGQATRWLSAYNLPSGILLVKILQAVDGHYLQTHKPNIRTEDERNYALTADGNALCPLMAGVALSDFIFVLKTGGTFRTGKIAYPLFTLPFLGRAAESLQINIEVSFDDKIFILTPNGIAMENISPQDNESLSLTSTENLSCQLSDKKPTDILSPSLKACQISPDAWKILTHFYMKTTVPESEISKLTGAGAGLNDND